MSVPLDRLYHFIENITEENSSDTVLIYRFWPHGSKNIQDLNPLYCIEDWFKVMTCLVMWCHDQEPLNYEFYKHNLYKFQKIPWQDLQVSLGLAIMPENLNWLKNIFKKGMLLHSEQRSENLEKYIADDTIVPVYYWCHAILAVDWFRYAKHADFKKCEEKTFLIYNRAWSGTREYRLKFTDLLIEQGLALQCMTFFNPLDNGQHYHDHAYANKKWQPAHALESYFDPSTADASASADFCTGDYQSTQIEVVLETLFDDDRIHLTEKSLRPIACGQPFILVATHGSLQYLRDYGFKTFDTVWDESYDSIADPYNRMQAILAVMQDITTWSVAEKQKKEILMANITKHNREHFNTDFFDLVVAELTDNMKTAIATIKTKPGFDAWTDRWQNLLQCQQVDQFLNNNTDLMFPTKAKYLQILQFIQQYQTHN